MVFELARMFPAYSPAAIAALPAKYYVAMRDYYYSVKKAEIESRPGYDPDLEVPGFKVVDFDKNVAEGKPI